MESEYQHKVLVVDDDEQVGKALDRILQKEKIEYVFANSGESALEEIKKTKKSFSLIISDQDLDGMKGTLFLEHAKKLTPDTARFLMTAHSEMETIINAVNKGEIQKYIVKPWEHDDLVKDIKSGIKLYEFFLDNEKLLTLAKKQNAKLYDLNCELMETTKTHNKTIHELDHDIEIIEKEIKDLSSKTPVNLDTLIDEIENSVKNDQGISLEKIQTLFSDTINGLYDQFSEAAYRNGFEMPDIKGEIK
ncbi:MAG: response regulator [Desulfobacula sp.]|uniref:response regulator n=1 Tax=Desulfobacula sp. TaxID=2593537 RepID=UPI0025BF33FF|nr:response regulator [Desulfobacula sp.]MCD4721107.1 response regulator [Desulfobacula sp.]